MAREIAVAPVFFFYFLFFQRRNHFYAVSRNVPLLQEDSAGITNDDEIVAVKSFEK